MTDSLRIAVIGAGAVGGVFGGRLAAAGHDVTFLARGATLAALRTDGLFIESVEGDLHLPVVQATDDPATIGPVDIILMGVKATQIQALAPRLRVLLAADTAVVPLQNGVEAGTQLAEALGDAHAMDGLCRIIAEQSGPGRIRHMAVTPDLEFGPRSRMPADAPARRQIVRFADALRGAGMKAATPEQMDVPVWEKFLFIEPFSTVGAASRSPIGVMRTVPETRALLNACMLEVQAVAAAAGVVLTDEVLTRTWARYDFIPPESTASLQRDLMAGRPSEFEAQTAAVVRLGQQLGVPTPVHAVWYAVLRPQAVG